MDHHPTGTLQHHEITSSVRPAPARFQLAAMCGQPPDAILNRVDLSCLIVDDSREFLEAASSLLAREGVAVVGAAGTASEALQLVAELRPQVVLVDIDLGGESGFEVTRRIAKAASTSVILISTHSEDDFADLIAESPATGFISKTELSGQAIRGLLDGRPGGGA
jgi:DNA-binding NarL/FixJ family response regulator